MNMFDSKSRTF